MAMEMMIMKYVNKDERRERHQAYRIINW